ncbi:EF-P lysine aminoacylase EpmA [Bacteriovorax sp. Seq25_V]|uniref:EF-P lysine aminoacylase EpmA n=1 Tax=Bacteriovorax sp. Seq25_V TaxID=1201288 RepID=UPI00038A316D|nr:EF-P lysine aminoacylase EpmA [Bacteriovorax sp. Seq25_V]EQC46912.1 EF-P lysine aminoacylase GenX [Bacteriovorax sp. Seq25_V]
MKKYEPLFIIQNSIKEYFNSKSFLEVITPPVVTNPGMETHIHPFQLHSIHAKQNRDLYLHTSPEFHMKSLLSEGYENIFTLSYAFRDEPDSTTHRKQFLMLEWYRSNERYEQIMQDCEELFSYCLNSLKSKQVPTNFEKVKFTRMTVAQAFKRYVGVNILDYLNKDDLYELIKNEFKTIHLAAREQLTWDDLFFLLMLNEVEPKFVEYDFLLLYEFPAPLKALSTIKESDPRVCERFEIYSRGVELCNCFNELTDESEQRARFTEQAKEKQNFYGYELPEASVLYSALKKGLPPSAGIALGVERLLMSLAKISNPFWD